MTKEVKMNVHKEYEEYEFDIGDLMRCDTIEDFKIIQRDLLYQYYKNQERWREWSTSLSFIVVRAQNDYDMKIALFFGTLCYDRIYSNDEDACVHFADNFIDALWSEGDWNPDKIHNFLVNIRDSIKDKKCVEETVGVINACFDALTRYRRGSLPGPLEGENRGRKKKKGGR
jgi:hypothetical protein